MTRPREILAHTGLRGLAAVVVLLAHLQLDKQFPFEKVKEACLFISWYGQAVDLFFILSGFVLCHVYAFVPSFSWRKYAVARFARVYPLAIVTLFACLALDFYSYIRHGMAAETLNSYRIFLNAFLLNGLTDKWVHEGINPPSWSVSVEALLYVIVFPVLIWVFRWSDRRRPTVALLVLFASLVLLVQCYVLQGKIPFLAEFVWLLRGVFGFTLGYSLRQAIQLRSLPQLSGVRASLVAWTGAVAMFSVLILRWPLYFLLPLFAVFVWITYEECGCLGRVLSSRVLVYLGERSYSIYLIHHGVILLCQRLILYRTQLPTGEFPLAAKLQTITAILVGTFILSDVSYRYFECPCRDFLRRRLSGGNAVS